MDGQLQQLIAIGIVVVCLLWLCLRLILKLRRRGRDAKKNCGGGCSACSPAALRQAGRSKKK